jgi:dGTPase
LSGFNKTLPFPQFGYKHKGITKSKRNVLNIAKYACNPLESKGRGFFEEEEASDIFLRDRQKVIHSSAFRRLEYKTQVFVNHVGDHYRTRLTHSMEVSQIARSISRKLGLNEDLAETVALSHDLGHPPFGHAGEDGLNEAAQDFGGFDHNGHTVKILVKLEQHYLGFDGVNLSLEALEGIAKHNGPITNCNSKTHLSLIKLLNNLCIDFHTQPSLEAQCSALSDDIAYINHDIDDGLRAGMFKLEDLEALPVVSGILQRLNKLSSDSQKIKYELIKNLSKNMVDDLVTQTLLNLKLSGIETYKDVLKQPSELVTFSPHMNHAKDKIKAFLMEKVYRNYRVNRMTAKAKGLITKLFHHYLQNPDCLPTRWYTRILDKSDQNEIASSVIDYIAGMTDRFAIKEYKRLFDPSLF